MKKINYEIIFVILFFLSRLPSLGNDNFNTDVWKWRARTYDFGQGIFTLDFNKTLQKYHPGVTLMWLGSAGVKVFNLYNEVVFHRPPLDNNWQTVFGLDRVQKIFVVLAIGVTLAFCLYVLRRTLGDRYALTALFFVSAEPFFIGLSRVYHLEGLMSTFMLASALWLYYYLSDRGNESRLMISGIFAGLAILTKTSSLYLLPYSMLVLFLQSYYENRKLGKSFKYFSKDLLKWVTSAFCTFFILWPSLWVNFSGTISTLYHGVSDIGVEGEHIQYYFGKLVSDPGYFYYIVVIGLRSTPYLLIGLLGCLVFIKSGLDKNRKQFLVFMLLFTLFYLLEITIPSKKLDRYVLPALMSLSLISSMFYSWLIEKFKISDIIKFPILLAALTILPFMVHPDYFSYYNPLFGGLRTGINIIEPKWMIGVPETMKFFKEIKLRESYADTKDDQPFEKIISVKQSPRILTVAYPEKYYTQIWPFFRQIKSYAVINSFNDFTDHSDYFVYPVWEDLSAEKTQYKLNLIGSIDVRGVPVYKVYKKNK